MGQISNIIDGWAKYLKGSNPEYVIKRAMICSSCPFAKEGTFESLLPDYSIQEVQGLKCEGCGCPLSTAIRSKDKKCPEGKW